MTQKQPKNDISWFIPFDVSQLRDITKIDVAEWKLILDICGYYEKDFADALNISPSTFSQRYAREYLPLDVLSRQALIDLIGTENFYEALGRWRLQEKRKYLLAHEFRSILKRCHITIEKFSRATPFSDATIARRFTPHGQNDVPLRFIDTLRDMLGAENFAIAIKHEREQQRPKASPIVDKRKAR